MSREPHVLSNICSWASPYKLSQHQPYVCKHPTTDIVRPYTSHALRGWCQSGVIHQFHITKSLFARVAKNKEMLAFSCEEHRDSR